MPDSLTGSLFSGYGGLDMAIEAVLGATPAWFVEFDQAPSRVLAHHWPTVPNHGDVTAVDWSAVEPVDILTGGFPCQDLSLAGNRAGLRPGTRSGLWTHMARAIDQLRPPLVVIENVRGLLSAEAHSDLERDCWCVGDGRAPTLRALGAVLGDLATLGYDARWCGLRAADAGSAHGRFRVFIIAHPHGEPWDDRRWAVTAAPKGAGALGERERRGGAPVTALLPTPKASDGPHGGPGARNGRGKPYLPGIRDFGRYAPAIARWETVTGTPAPPPTEPGKTGNSRLSARFVEWLMGLAPGHVTDRSIGLTYGQQLRVLGNGVVPQQAALALRLMGIGADDA